MATKQGYIGIPLIPAEYERIAFLMTDGASYINTGWTPTEKTRIVLDNVQNYYNGFLCGCRGYNLTGNIYNSQFYVQVSNGGYTYCYGSPSYNMTANFAITLNSTAFDLNQAEFYINGSRKKTSGATQDFDGQGPIELFACPTYQTQTGSPVFSTRSYSPVGITIGTVKIYENGVLKRNMAPCRRVADQALGMYDKVTMQFYPNSGTGSFSCSSTLLPSEYQQLEYIQGDGASYVRPDYYPTGYTHIRVGTSDYNTNGQDIFGMKLVNGSVNQYFAIQAYNSKYRIYYGTTATNFSTTTSLSASYMCLDVSRNTVTRNGVSEVSGSSSTFTNTSRRLFIFAQDNAGTVTRYSTAKIYWMLIWGNTSGAAVSMVLIPAKRISDSALGFYNLLDSTFITQQGGSGSLIGGDEYSYSMDLSSSDDDDGVAQIIRHLYIGGRDGTAIRVMKAYIGDSDGVARLWYDRSPNISSSDYSWSGTTSDCVLSTDSLGWTLMIKGSGTLTMNKNVDVDIFIVGGGGAGGNSQRYESGRLGSPGGGGGSGYVYHKLDFGMYADMDYTMSIGAGGSAHNTGDASDDNCHSGNSGESSSFRYTWNNVTTTFTAAGGKGGEGGFYDDTNGYNCAGSGGDGGSGGGAGNGGTAGTNGSDGGSTSKVTSTQGVVYGNNGGTGANITTYPFQDNRYTQLARGGRGGNATDNSNGADGTASTGNGGNGAGSEPGTSSVKYGGSGGSGVIILRNWR